MADRPDEQRLAAWRAFLFAHSRLTDRLADELECDADLPLAWYDVLLNLHESGGSLRMQELADAILLSRSGLTRLIDRMVAAGLVAREPVECDRRGTLAVITDEGRRRLRKAAPVHLKGIQEHFAAHLTDEEAAAVQSAFERILAALENRSPDGSCG